MLFLLTLYNSYLASPISLLLNVVLLIQGVCFSRMDSLLGLDLSHPILPISLIYRVHQHISAIDKSFSFVQCLYIILHKLKMVFMRVNAETMRHFCKLEFIRFCSILAMGKHQMLLVCLFHVLQIETNVFLRE